MGTCCSGGARRCGRSPGHQKCGSHPKCIIELVGSGAVLHPVHLMGINTDTRAAEKGYSYVA